MKVLPKLEDPGPLLHPFALCIGNFDGVHLGHQALIKRMRTLVGTKGTVALLTFANHPSTILPNRTPVKPIQSRDAKLKYLKQYGVDVLFILPFTPELSSLSYEEFIKEVREVYPFDTLVAGKGDTFGRNREGTEDRVTALGQKLHFSTEYLQKTALDGEEISSQKIRSHLKNQNSERALKMLGHPLE